VEAHESLTAAAAREVREEIGVGIAADDLAPIGMIRYADEEMAGLDVYFTVSRIDGEPQPVSECDAVDWFDRESLPVDVVPWLPGALTRLLDEGAWFTDLVDAKTS
jgi:ADP-ribose pyrophosphatase YjhB (NUDIX family)